ncbi:unnamed protein product [Dibothriocephalus latus]|uniref:Uncharacterized protein n=1 Tax=Dibothriocephalus latus TaxID=60516 RepID=A0A3P7PG74_DIBLA|nr:unnamed protein product [Dibothriocephalus latus]
MIPPCCPLCRGEFTAAQARPSRLLNDLLELVQKGPQENRPSRDGDGHGNNTAAQPTSLDQEMSRSSEQSVQQ